MPHWESIQGLAIGLPLGHVLLQQELESCVVGRLDDVKQLVDKDVLQTLSGLLGEVGVETDGPVLRVTACLLYTSRCV